MHRILQTIGIVTLVLVVLVGCGAATSENATTDEASPTLAGDSSTASSEQSPVPTAVADSRSESVEKSLNAPSLPTDEPPEDTESDSTPISLEVGDPEQGKAYFHAQEQPETEEVFIACKTCHFVDANLGVLIGPNLAGIADHAGTRVEGQSAVEYLHRSIIKHDEHVVEGFEPDLMISIAKKDFGEVLQTEDIDHLVAYLLTLTEDEISDAPLPTATIAPGDTVTPDADGYVVADDGFAFQPVEGWDIGAFDKTLITRPEDATYEQGPVIAIRHDLVKNLNIPNVKTSKMTVTTEFLDAMFINFEDETAEIVFTDEEDTEIGGAQARVASFAGIGFGDLDVDEVKGRIAVAKVGEKHTFVMIGIASPPDAWDADAVFESMLQSVRFDGVENASGHTDVDVQQVDMSVHDDQALYNIVLMHHTADGSTAIGDAEVAGMLPPARHAIPLQERDRDKGPRFACVHCHVTHEVEMNHESNAGCITCHSGTPYQRHCVDCHSMHSVRTPHEPENPSCESCHVQGIPMPGVDVQRTLITFLSYLFGEI